MEHKGKVPLKTLLNCPKIKNTKKEATEILKILKESNQFTLTEVSEKPEEIYFSNDAIKQVIVDNQELSEDDHIYKIVSVQKGESKIFFNDVEF